MSNRSRISDSFDPGHGVLIQKVKNTSSNCGAGVNAPAVSYTVKGKPAVAG